MHNSNYRVLCRTKFPLRRKTLQTNDFELIVPDLYMPIRSSLNCTASFTFKWAFKYAYPWELWGTICDISVNMSNHLQIADFFSPKWLIGIIQDLVSKTFDWNEFPLTLSKFPFQGFEVWESQVSVKQFTFKWSIWTIKTKQGEKQLKHDKIEVGFSNTDTIKIIQPQKLLWWIAPFGWC